MTHKDEQGPGPEQGASTSTDLLISAVVSWLALIGILFWGGGCGGGSTGTGSGTRFIDGRLSSNGELPVVGARIVDLQSGDSTTTDSDGSFALQNDSTSPSVELEIESPIFQGTVAVPSTPSDAQENSSKDAPAPRITLDIQVNAKTQTAIVDNVQVVAQVIGACDIAFENRAIIRQSNRIRNGTRCTMRIRVSSDGAPLAHIPFVLQSKRCGDPHTWRDDASGVTVEDGSGLLDFTFRTDAAHCEYRLLAPYPVKDQEPIIFPFETFEKVRYLSAISDGQK